MRPYAKAAAQWNAWIDNIILLTDTNRNVGDWPSYVATADTIQTTSSKAFFESAATARSAALTALAHRNQIIVARNQVSFWEGRVAAAQNRVDMLEAGRAALQRKGLTLADMSQVQSALAATQPPSPAATSTGAGATDISALIAQIPGLGQIPGLSSLIQSFIQDWQKQNKDDRERMKKELQARRWQPWGCITGESKGAECGLPPETSPAQTPPTQTPPPQAPPKS